MKKFYNLRWTLYKYLLSAICVICLLLIAWIQFGLKKTIHYPYLVYAIFGGILIFVLWHYRGSCLAPIEVFCRQHQLTFLEIEDDFNKSHKICFSLRQGEHYLFFFDTLGKPGILSLEDIKGIEYTVVSSPRTSSETISFMGDDPKEPLAEVCCRHKKFKEHYCY